MFALKKKLKIHEKIHNKTSPYKCSKCDRGFSTKGNMQDHERRHDQVK